MLRIRQLALVARDLESVVEDLRAVFGLEVCFRDPGVATFGLVNALLPIGTTFLEIVSPDREGTTAGRLLDRRGSDGGYMVLLQTDDLAGARARAERAGARVVWELALDDIATVHLHPRDVGGAIVSLDESHPAEAWRWAGPDWRASARTAVVQAIVGAEIESADPEGLARRWHALFGGDVRRVGDAWQLRLDESAIRFAPGPGDDAFTGVDLRTPGRDRAIAAARERGLPVDGAGVTIAGTRFRLVATSSD